MSLKETVTQHDIMWSNRQLWPIVRNLAFLLLLDRYVLRTQCIDDALFVHYNICMIYIYVYIIYIQPLRVVGTNSVEDDCEE